MHSIIIALSRIIFFGIREDFTPCPKSPKYQKTTILSDIIQTSSPTLLKSYPGYLWPLFQKLLLYGWTHCNIHTDWHYVRMTSEPFIDYSYFSYNYCISYNVYTSYNIIWNGLLSWWTLLVKQTIIIHILQMNQKDDEAFFVHFFFNVVGWFVVWLGEGGRWFLVFVLKGIWMPCGSTKR